MILLEPGYVGGSANPQYININGVPVHLSTVSFLPDKKAQQLSISFDGDIVYANTPFSLFTGDVTYARSMASFEELLATIDELIGVYADGVKPYKRLSTADTNETLVKAGKATLHQLFATTIGRGTAYIKLYDMASVPVVGTDVPVMTIDVATISGSLAFTPALPFKRGLAFAITGAMDDRDTTAIGAGDVIMTMMFE